ncbi:thermonuclease family protein [Candidimonas humi]|jgi:endonuclease YncB( thermonuclease family)|uniref:Thermonuclease family protein n=1 Tax=Candidimonas humi TaxID=683355 RepID=A0ABV8NZ62_9BURK|nr:thermonuclease family protein [Candidimonas humi]MBV6306485.1 thermonuclease family protein [Candidimonas humi]
MIRLGNIVPRGGRAAMAALALAAACLAPAHARRAPLPPSSQQQQYVLAGRVVHVADGDTFTLLVDGRCHRIRMASIDAPETSKGSDRPGQPMAQASRKALAGLVAGKILRLECYERDRYGRDVCDVPLGDGRSANREQVAAGMAWANMEGRGRFMRDPRMQALEQRARRERLGLWRDPQAAQPWVWRYQCWKQGRC